MTAGVPIEGNTLLRMREAHCQMEFDCNSPSAASANVCTHGIIEWRLVNLNVCNQSKPDASHIEWR